MRLDQVCFSIPSGELVTVTVEVDSPGRPRGGPERRRAEAIAARLWMIVQLPEPPAPTSPRAERLREIFSRARRKRGPTFPPHET